MQFMDLPDYCIFAVCDKLDEWTRMQLLATNKRLYNLINEEYISQSQVSISTHYASLDKFMLRFKNSSRKFGIVKLKKFGKDPTAEKLTIQTYLDGMQRGNYVTELYLNEICSVALIYQILMLTPRLKKLDLCIVYTPVFQNMDKIDKYFKLEKMESLSLTFQGEGPVFGSLAVFIYMLSPNLKVLRLKNCYISVVLSLLHTRTKLETLNLEKVHIFENRLPTDFCNHLDLKKILLKDVDFISNQGIGFICDFSKSVKSLEVLQLDRISCRARNLSHDEYPEFKNFLLHMIGIPLKELHI